MSKTIAFAGSNSSTSINYQLLEYINNTADIDCTIIDTRKLDIPMFGVDLEEKIGSPKDIELLYSQIESAHLVLIATPEHNGNMTSYLKSILDWLSRVNRDFLLDKKVAIIGTSTGRKGAQVSIERLQEFVERFNGNLLGTFSLPSFNHVFENGQLIEEHAKRLNDFINTIKK